LTCRSAEQRSEKEPAICQSEQLRGSKAARAMRNQDEDGAVDEQIEDLRERMRLLQGDRKANIDILEGTKNQNKGTITKLRNENKEIRKELALVKGNFSASGADEAEEVAEVKAQVNKLRKQYDELKNRSADQSKILDELKDNVKDLELEARRPNLEDSPLTRKIRMLENRLDKAMIKYNEAQSIKKTYEQIVKRLKEERVGFDNQLAAIERTLAAKQHDYEELLLLSADANHAREVAVQELERVKGGYEEVKRHREKELRERQQEAQVKSDMQARIEKREKLRQEIIAKEAGDLGEEEEDALKANVVTNKLQEGKVAEERTAHRSKIDVFETAFRKIKEATGVSDVNEVIQKIVSQESTTDNLMMLTRENQTKIELLNEEKAALKARVEEIKYSGPGGGHRRKMVDDHEENLSSSAAKLERCRLKYERLAKMLISVKAGIDHLADKLDQVREDSRQITMTDDTIVDVMYQCEQTLVNLLQSVKAHEEKRHVEAELAEGMDGAIVEQEESTFKVSESDLVQTRPFNQRIHLPNGENAEDDEDGEEGAEVGDEEELTRDKVKKASCQILSTQEKKKKKGKHGKKKGGGDFMEDIGGGGGGRKGAKKGRRKAPV